MACIKRAATIFMIRKLILPVVEYQFLSFLKPFVFLLLLVFNNFILSMSYCFGEATPSSSLQDHNQQSKARVPSSYVNLPLKQLVKRIPELKGISPPPNEQALGTILQNTGARVDEFLVNVIDTVAHEDIAEQRVISTGMPGTQAGQHMQDSYLILRTTDSTHQLEEFRMDAKGNRMDESGLDKGFFITSGFALSSVHFATQFQRDSRFLYLGDQKIDGRDTYVVAFAQLPSEARIAVTIQGRNGKTFRMLCQGIAWIDKASFHILQMRTDLLAPRPEIGLDQQTTKITYSEVRFADLATPLWLPLDVNVYIRFTDRSEALQYGNQAEVVDLGPRVTDQTFRNVHHYSSYQRYRVSTKILQSH